MQTFKNGILIFVLFGFWHTVFAASEINSNWLGLAIGGYDPVAYFTENKAIRGKSEFKIEWRGAKWRFSSANHLNQFRQQPEKFAPQYGGYCAYAVANNGLADGDPLQWYIENDKLYLNVNAEIKIKWLEQKDSYINSANENWPQVLSK